MKIRASVGTAAVLGLQKMLLQAVPTTAYLMLYSEEHCSANCSFCPQAQSSDSKTDKLSRVLWPAFEIDELLDALNRKDHPVKRICIQTVSYKNSDEDLLKILSQFSSANLSIPLSVCSYPLPKATFEKMRSLGVKRIGISYDCATPEIYANVKGENRGVDFSWQDLDKTLQDAIDVFGNRFVSTHLIIGLDETEKEAIEFMQKFHNQKITIGLFAFTPVKGTDLEKKPQPKIDSYRRIQLARSLIISGKTSLSKMKFSNEGRIIDYGIQDSILLEEINNGKPFQTTGCPHCNRPFYNESPGKELYNFPTKLADQDIANIKQYFKEFL
ncbi:MAG: radical SAM protein, partial [Candidatus Heimdallarchaeota archaeon]